MPCNLSCSSAIFKCRYTTKSLHNFFFVQLVVLLYICIYLLVLFCNSVMSHQSQVEFLGIFALESVTVLPQCSSFTYPYRYIVRAQHSITCVTCKCDIFSSSHLCRMPSRQLNEDSRIKNLNGLLTCNDSKIYRLVDTKEEYEREKHSKTTYIYPNDIMLLELLQRPFCAWNKTFWITRVAGQRVIPYIPIQS